MTAELQRRIQAVEMRCYCKVLCTSYKDRVTNKEARAKIQQEIRPHEYLLTIVKRPTAVVWTCIPFIRSGQNHLARHSERGKKARQTEEEARRQHQRMDRPRVCLVQKGSEKQKNGGNWLWNHLRFPKDPCHQGIDDDDKMTLDWMLTCRENECLQCPCELGSQVHRLNW